MNFIKSFFCKHEYLIHAVIPTIDNEIIVGLVCRKCLLDDKRVHNFYSRGYNIGIEKMLITNGWVTLNKDGGIARVNKEKNINIHTFKDMLKKGEIKVRKLQ